MAFVEPARLRCPLCGRERDQDELVPGRLRDMYDDTLRKTGDAHKEAVLRAWCLLSGIDYDEFVAEVERRKEQHKAELEQAIFPEVAE